MTPWRPRRSSFSDVHCHRPDNKQNGAKGENPAQPAEAIGTPYLRHVPYRQPIPFGCCLTIASCATGQLPVPSKMGGWLSLPHNGGHPRSPPLVQARPTPEAHSRNSGGQRGVACRGVGRRPSVHTLPAVAITSHLLDTGSLGWRRTNQVGTVSRPNRSLCRPHARRNTNTPGLDPR